MSEITPAGATADYASFGYVGNPFPPIDASSTDPLWMRIVTHAASNSLLSGVMRARTGERSRPVVVAMTDDIPEYYHRCSQNAFLRRTVDEPGLELMALNVPLEMMRLGSVRGTLAEVAELVAAVGLGITVGAYFVDALATQDATLPEFSALEPGQLASARDEFIREPEAAMERYLGSRAAIIATGPSVEEDDALHEVYLRQVGLELNPDEQQELAGEEAQVDAGPPAAALEPPLSPIPDDAIRGYLLAYVRANLSPVIARAMAAYSEWGQSIVAQELKVTKAPRKTLTAILRLMSHRWKNIVVLYDRLDAWPLMDQATRMDVLGALTELRWIIGEFGVMGVAVMKEQSVEIEEQFAAGERIDWSMPEITALYNGDFAFDCDRVQRWLDAAAITGVSAIKVGGTELAPLVEACENDIRHFVLMAEAAFRDAGERGASTLDVRAISAGLASATIEDGV